MCGVVPLLLISLLRPRRGQKEEGRSGGMEEGGLRSGSTVRDRRDRFCKKCVAEKEENAEEEEEEVYAQKGGGQMKEGPAKEGVWGGGAMMFLRRNTSRGANENRRWRRRGMGKSKNYWPLREPILVGEHIIHSKLIREHIPHSKSKNLSPCSASFSRWLLRSLLAGLFCSH